MNRAPGHARRRRQTASQHPRQPDGDDAGHRKPKLVTPTSQNAEIEDDVDENDDVSRRYEIQIAVDAGIARASEGALGTEVDAESRVRVDEQLANLGDLGLDRRVEFGGVE